MNTIAIIAKKRDGQALSQTEIEWLIKGYVDGAIPDYQMSAFLMAVYFRGMTVKETVALTMAMARSGQMIDLSDIEGIKVDKHSTGGVADTTTLVVAPLLAAAGVKVAKMSGRGLGFTGGTIDKLESIPGLNTMLKLEDFKQQVKTINIAVTGQTKAIAPADGKLYALRDVTATVESIPLIASSIMSKKIAAGADKILLDVKVGKGAFMESFDDAITLAKLMVAIGAKAGKKTVALITNMDEPLGCAVGNSLEVLEAMSVLAGGGPEPLKDICLTLGAHMLLLAGTVHNIAEGKSRLNELIDTKAALYKFQEFITAQGGADNVINEPSILPHARYQHKIFSSSDGLITEVDARKIGFAAMQVGAGREVKGAAIDLAAGVVLHVRTGDKLKKGQPLASIYTNDEARLPQAVSMVQAALIISEDRVVIDKKPLVYGIVDENGYTCE